MRLKMKPSWTVCVLTLNTLDPGVKHESCANPHQEKHTRSPWLSFLLWNVWDWNLCFPHYRPLMITPHLEPWTNWTTDCLNLLWSSECFCSLCHCWLRKKNKDTEIKTWHSYVQSFVVISYRRFGYNRVKYRWSAFLRFFVDLLHAVESEATPLRRSRWSVCRLSRCTPSGRFLCFLLWVYWG